MPEPGSNRLAAETSPYLLQHARNPVDWYPWGDEALARARETDRPILLSIGYTACHWCHVMARESFEDPATAALMNDHFVCIKVDREERPDLDRIYQLAHQILGQRPGGWPLTIAMDPVHHVPFFAGTYFPDRPRHGMPAFTDVLKRIADFYERSKNETLPAHVSAMKEALGQLASPAPGEVDASLPDQAARELENAFDAANGGFGSAPKFPHTTNLTLCLRLGEQGGTAVPGPRLLDMAAHSLRAMTSGGLFDHLGGGFFRYSVDARWEIPHFEKMLYDNAQLLPLYADAARVFGDRQFHEAAVLTGRWVEAEMQAPAGGYYSTLDADSAGEEGGFYLWTREQLTESLDETEWAVMESRFGLEEAANFGNKWHLNIRRDLTAVAEQTGLELETAESVLEGARLKLLEVRARRARPLRDEKILTAWTALTARGMARAGMQLGEAAFIDSADRAIDFVQRELWRDGRLMATTRDGITRLNAYLDDHAFLADALLTLVECRWDGARLAWAAALAEVMLEQFEDPERGGMYFTSHDHETLLHRDKPGMDDATPSGNGIAARVLLRLGHLLAEPRYLRSAEAILESLAGMMSRYPSAHGALMEALCEYHEPVETIVLRGDAEALTEWRARCGAMRASRQVFAVPEPTAGPLPGIISAMTPRGAATAYICRGTACSEPISNLSEFERRLANTP